MKPSKVKSGRVPVFKTRLNILKGDLSVSEFAEKIGLSRQTTGFYLNGDRVPDAQTILQICQECNVSADWLLGIAPENVQTTDTKLRTVSEVTGLSDVAVRTLSGINTYGPTKSLKALETILQHEQMWNFLSRQEETVSGINLLWHIGGYLSDDRAQNHYFVYIDSKMGYPEKRVEISADNYITHGEPLAALYDRATLDTISDCLKQIRKKNSEKP